MSSAYIYAPIYEESLTFDKFPYQLYANKQLVLRIAFRKATSSSSNKFRKSNHFSRKIYAQHFRGQPAITYSSIRILMFQYSDAQPRRRVERIRAAALGHTGFSFVYIVFSYFTYKWWYLGQTCPLHY